MFFSTLLLFSNKVLIKKTKDNETTILKNVETTSSNKIKVMTKLYHVNTIP